MEIREMRRVIVQAHVENVKDAWEVERGLRSAEDARKLTVDDALVDTGATSLSLPSRRIAELGLKKDREQRVRTSVGVKQASVYEPVRLTIQGRQCLVEVFEVPDDIPTLIGQIPLEWLDFVVDPNSQRLIGNPAHGGQHLLDMF